MPTDQENRDAGMLASDPPLIVLGESRNRWKHGGYTYRANFADTATLRLHPKPSTAMQEGMTELIGADRSIKMSKHPSSAEEDDVEGDECGCLASRGFVITIPFTATPQRTCTVSRCLRSTRGIPRWEAVNDQDLLPRGLEPDTSRLDTLCELQGELQLVYRIEVDLCGTDGSAMFTDDDSGLLPDSLEGFDVPFDLPDLLGWKGYHHDGVQETHTYAETRSELTARLPAVPRNVTVYLPNGDIQPNFLAALLEGSTSEVEDAKSRVLDGDTDCRYCSRDYITSLQHLERDWLDIKKTETGKWEVAHPPCFKECDTRVLLSDEQGQVCPSYARSSFAPTIVTYDRADDPICEQVALTEMSAFPEMSGPAMEIESSRRRSSMLEQVMASDLHMITTKQCASSNNRRFSDP